MAHSIVRQYLTLAALVASSSAFATSSTAPTVKATTVAGSTTVTSPSTTSTASGPQVADTFRVLKTDGSTIIQQGSMTMNTAAIATLNVSDSDALVKSAGKCAFNVKYDETSGVAAKGTTNRLYSNDTLIAQNTMIDLVPGAIKTIWTQPYLVAGMNNIRVVVNADSTAPSTKWIRVNVSGTCGGATPPPTTTTTTTPPTTKPPVTTPPVTTPPPVVVSFTPGSAEWTSLNNVFGYSNYAATQLKGKNYARYSELVVLNATITAAINAKTITQSAYNSLMTSWNTFVTDSAFKSIMSTVVPSTTGK